MDRISLLLVDDNPTFLEMATRFLQGHEDLAVVGTARGGEEALKQARDLHPDVVLLDLAMPKLNGLGVIPHLRSTLPDMGIIVLTLLDASAYRQAALDAGADDFVSKTALVADLLPAIRRVAEARAADRDT
jgi:DNA-binding NarL/FixJ family response regulator